ncbi:MAG: type III PLP-dependent enzyme [Gammaproteobacteria bacterium]|jgi:ornithine decarboxylase
MEISLLTKNYDWENLVKQYGSPLLILDCNTLRNQYRRLKESLPTVDLYFAIKSLPNETVINVLHKEGCHFDIATQGEVKLLENNHVPANKTIHTHPIKRDIDIRSTLRFGCTTFVVDNEFELDKFVRYKERVGLLLRLSFTNPNAVVNLSKKFGLSVDEAPAFINRAERLGIHIKGISFHVGSQSKIYQSHVDAIAKCMEIIETNRQTRDVPMSILDIGGGFPINYDGTDIDIEEFCNPINNIIQTLPKNIKVIAEPGRYISGPAMTCITTVIGKANRAGIPWYYLDDGVYNSFSGQIFDHAIYPIIPIRKGKTRSSVLAGPTCDSIDVISENIELPELDIGDVIVAPMMGAYTSATATEFNSLPRTHIIAVNVDESPDTNITQLV